MIRICEPDISGEEIGYVMDALQKNELSGHGSHVKEFEKRFADFIGVNCCIMVPNGTIAVQLALAAMGIKAGDEVIVPSQTISCVASSIVQLGAMVVAVDVDRRSWALDAEKLEEAITDKTKAIIPTPVFAGIPPNMERVMEIAAAHDIMVLEDFAESIGATYRYTKPDHLGWRKLGSIGDAGCCSFFANKNITTGEGGAVVTDQYWIEDKARYLRNNAFGTSAETKFNAQELGYNFRPMNLQAAIGLGQMDRIYYLLNRRNSIFSWYKEYLSPEFEWQQWDIDRLEAVVWMETVLVPKRRGLPQKSLFMDYLMKNGVESRPTFPPIGQQVFLNKMGMVRSHGEEVSQEIWDNGVILPSGGPNLTEDAVRVICHAANRFIAQ